MLRSLAIPFPFAVICAVGVAPPANALGTASSSPIRTIEQRVAWSHGGNGDTVWSSLRGEATSPTTMAVIVAIPSSGGVVDAGSPAFFEALEASTAPRVLPPQGLSAVCPGEADEPRVSVEGDLEARVVPAVVETVQLENAAALTAWATTNGMPLSASLSASLVGSTSRYFALRFQVDGAFTTPTVRVWSPGGVPSLPFTLTEAKEGDLRVTLFAFGAGSALVPGGEASVDATELTFDAAQATTNYPALRATALAPNQSFLIESSSHDALRSPVPVGPSPFIVPSFISEYFARAEAIGDADEASAICVSRAASALADASIVGRACPRGDWGTSGAPASCVPSVAGGEIDPALLDCGPRADDLSLALTGVVAADGVVTRLAWSIDLGEVGANTAVSLVPKDIVSGVLSANGLDYSACAPTGAGGASTTATTSGGPQGAGPSGAGGGSETVYVEVPVRALEGCGCDGTYEIIDYVIVDEESAPEYYYADEDCSGETYESSGESYETEAGDCQGDTSETDSYDSSGCDSDTSDGSGGSSDDGWSDDDDDGSSDGSTDESSSSETDSTSDCTVARAPTKKRVAMRPRMSMVFMALAALLLPIRRARRRR